jgi:hypothetical protein
MNEAINTIKFAFTKSLGPIMLGAFACTLIADATGTPAKVKKKGRLVNERQLRTIPAIFGGSANDRDSSSGPV